MRPRKFHAKPLTNCRKSPIMLELTGCGEVWYRAGSGPRGLRFESRHSDQIRLKSFDFSRISAFSELFPMENSAHFPSDPNATQTEFGRKVPKVKIAACRSSSDRRRSYFALFFSKRYSFVYSNAFFEASLLSCCADNLLFTDAKHTDAVFHR